MESVLKEHESHPKGFGPIFNLSGQPGAMNCQSWKCRELGNPWAVSALPLSSWERKLAMCFRGDIDMYKKRLVELRGNSDPASVQQFQDCKRGFLKLLAQEEDFWR
ncbi:hypothetical protein PTKIN_Ptkin19aG0006700 [Pterospermum kingtungense]